MRLGLSYISHFQAHTKRQIISPVNIHYPLEGKSSRRQKKTDLNLILPFFDQSILIHQFDGCVVTFKHKCNNFTPQPSSMVPYLATQLKLSAHNNLYRAVLTKFGQTMLCDGFYIYIFLTGCY